MGAIAINLEDVQEPAPQEIEAARVAARALASARDRQIQVVSADGKGEPLILPASAFRTLVKMLLEIGNGNAVAVVPIQAELTTQQAADLLNVSRPHLIKLLERGDLPHRMVGTHRKLQAKDVLNYRSRVDLARAQALAAMAEADQEDGLYDDAHMGQD